MRKFAGGAPDDPPHKGGEIRKSKAEIADLKVDTHEQIADLKSFVLWGFGVAFAGIFTLIAFVLWDRRTAIAPAIRRTAGLEDRTARLEAVLKDFAPKSPPLAESLKKLGLL